MNESAHPDGLPTEVLEDVASVVGTEITLLSRLPGGINAGATRVQLAEGVNAEVTFHPRMENVVSYTYRIENGPEQTMSAGTDGTAATTFTFDKPGSYTVYFRSTDSSGYTTLDDEAPIWVQEPYEDPGDPF